MLPARSEWMNHSFKEAEPVDQGRGAPYRGHIAKLPELLQRL
jgi:hypothetical protein